MNKTSNKTSNLLMFLHMSTMSLSLGDCNVMQEIKTSWTISPSYGYQSGVTLVEHSYHYHNIHKIQKAIEWSWHEDLVVQRNMVILIARRWRGRWEGVPMATWCSEWICESDFVMQPISLSHTWMSHDTHKHMHTSWHTCQHKSPHTYEYVMLHWPKIESEERQRDVWGTLAQFATALQIHNPRILPICFKKTLLVWEKKKKNIYIFLFNIAYTIRGCYE